MLFFFGLISGVAITLIVEGGMLKKALANPDAGRQIVAGRLTRELDLSDEQVVEVNDILLSTQGELEIIRDEVAPWIEETIRESKARIEEILTPEQKERFEVMVERFEGAREQWRMRHRHRNRGGRGNEGGGGGGMHRMGNGHWVEE